MSISRTPESTPRTSLEEDSFVRQHFGHQYPIASECGHEMHPSGSARTPWCPPCAISKTRTRFEDAQKKLVIEGGLQAPRHLRDRRWNQVRRRYLIAKERLKKTRRNEQLRWEREQAWDDAHRRYDSQRMQAAVKPQNPVTCLACVSMVAQYPTSIPKAPVARYVPWWEQPGALAVDHILVPRTPSRFPCRNGKRLRTKGSRKLREFIEAKRNVQYWAEIHRKGWEARKTTEAAVRRKYKLEESVLPSSFWVAPICGIESRQNHRNRQDEKRIAERCARGYRPRPKPPHSSLSNTESAEEVRVDQDWIERLTQKERREQIERETKKTTEQIGYLYVVGGPEHMFKEWREDVSGSNWGLVFRNRLPSFDSSTTETSEYSDEDQTEDEEDTDEDETEDEEDSNNEDQTRDESVSESNGKDSVAIVDEMDVDDF